MKKIQDLVLLVTLAQVMAFVVSLSFILSDMANPLLVVFVSEVAVVLVGFFLAKELVLYTNEHRED